VVTAGSVKESRPEGRPKYPLSGEEQGHRDDAIPDHEGRRQPVMYMVTGTSLVQAEVRPVRRLIKTLGVETKRRGESNG
jgi:hypothetical protein